MNELSYKDKVTLAKTLQTKLGGEYCWELLCCMLADKGLIQVDKTDIEICKYPGCSSIGKGFIDHLSTMFPRLTVDTFCEVAKKENRNDICCLLQSYVGGLLADIPHMKRVSLQHICGVSHYTSHEGSWKILAEELQISEDAVREIEQSSLSSLNRFQCEEMFNLLKTNAPRLTLQNLVGALQELNFNDSANALAEIIVNKQNDHEYKETVHFK